MGRSPQGDDALVEERFRPRQDPPRRLEDGRRTAAVDVEDDGGVDGEVLDKMFHHARVRAAPRKDGLLVVAHGKQVAVLAGEQFQDGVLRLIKVLKLINKHVVPHCTPGGESGGAALQQLVRQRQDLVEVDQVIGTQLAVVAPEQLFIRPGQSLVLSATAEEGEERAMPLRVDAEPAENESLMLLISDAEASRQTDAMTVCPQDTQAQRMDGA